MLEVVDAEEIARWKAYEIVTGRIDDSYSREMLARICDLLMMQMVKKEDFEPTPRPGRPEEKKLTPEEEEAEKLAVTANLAAALGAKL